MDSTTVVSSMRQTGNLLSDVLIDVLFDLYEGCSISPGLLERWYCYRKYVTTLRECHLTSVRIKSFKSVRRLEKFLQPVDFSFSLVEQNYGKFSNQRADLKLCIRTDIR